MQPRIPAPTSTVDNWVYLSILVGPDWESRLAAVDALAHADDTDEQADAKYDRALAFIETRRPDIEWSPERRDSVRDSWNALRRTWYT